MRLFEKKWRAAHHEVLSKHGDRLWWLKVRLYPKRAFLESSSERCSLCKAEWSNIDGAINHVTGLPHFRQWCIENPSEAVNRWGEDLRQLIAEETLAGAAVAVSA